MSIVIEKINLISGWDEKLKEFNGSIFMSSEWLESLKADDRKPVYLVFNIINDAQALLAGFERPVYNSNYKQLFFYSGIIAREKNLELIKDCKNALVHFCRKNKYSRIIMKSYDFFDQLQVSAGQYIPFKRAECVISLLKTEEELINNIAKRYRSYIRKGKRNGVVFKYGNSPKLLKTFYELLDDTFEVRTSKGYAQYKIFTMPFMEREQMKRLIENGAASLYYVEKDGEILSMQFLLNLAGRAYMLLMGTSPTGYKLSAPSVLIYDSIIKLKREGIDSYNLGGIPLGEENDGVKRFKIMMGASVLESVEESTDFIISPLNHINFLLMIKRFLLNVRLPWIVKKQLLRGIDFYIMGRDQY